MSDVYRPGKGHVWSGSRLYTVEEALSVVIHIGLLYIKLLFSLSLSSPPPPPPPTSKRHHQPRRKTESFEVYNWSFKKKHKKTLTYVRIFVPSLLSCKKSLSSRVMFIYFFGRGRRKVVSPPLPPPPLSSPSPRQTLRRKRRSCRPGLDSPSFSSSFRPHLNAKMEGWRRAKWTEPLFLGKSLRERGKKSLSSASGGGGSSVSLPDGAGGGGRGRLKKREEWKEGCWKTC